MPRYRHTTEGSACLVGRLLILLARGKETSATVAGKLGVSARQVNRYVVQLRRAGWRIARRGVPTHKDYWFELESPRLVFPPAGQGSHPGGEPPDSRPAPRKRKGHRTGGGKQPKGDRHDE